MLLLVAALAVAVKGIPLLALALQGRRMEDAVRRLDASRLLRASSGATGQGELRRVLRKLPTEELLRVGGAVVVEAADTERGVEVLEVVIAMVERRQGVLARFSALRESVSREKGGTACP